MIRRGQAPADAPFAVTRKAKNRIELAAVNVPARRAGLNVGLALADARARLPHLIVTEENEAADLALLDEIAAWCERFTPVVVLDPPAGLFLDVAGVAHLFGSETALRALIVQRLQAQGFHAPAAIAATPGAAWALARYAKDSAELAPLPVEALRLTEDARDFLRRMGLTRIGQILTAPRNSFAARAGENALLRLDQALGRASEVLTSRRPPPPIFAGRRFLEPLCHEDAILIGLDHAADDVMIALERRGAGASRFALDLFATSGGAKRLSVGLSRPARNRARLVRLFREKFAALTSPLCDEFGIEAIRLSAFELRTLDERASDWLEQQSGEADLNALMDALSSRLGPQAALRPQIRAEHLPERAGILTCDDETTGPAAVLENDRPLRLFSPPQPVEALAAVPDGPPERFRWRRVLRRVVRAEGPERIAPPWFNADAGPTRDYFRIEDDSGRRYWLFREGLYGEVEAPRWFIHGLFA